MSNQITTARVQGFKRGVDILSQQKGSRLQMAVRNEDQASKQEHYDQIGATAAVQRLTRHGDTPLVNTPHSRRAITLSDWEWADLIDKQDRLRVLNDPTNPYSTNAAYAMGRVKDQLLVAAFHGAALTGETGSSSTPHDTANDVETQGAPNGALTLTKLREARAILGLNLTDDEPSFIACTHAEINQLLGSTTITSSDFNTVKALVQGEIDSFMGFKFITMDPALLPHAVATTRGLPFWRMSGMVLATGVGLAGSSARIDERADKGYATQVYYAGSYGATRMEEAKVGRIWVDSATAVP